MSSKKINKVYELAFHIVPIISESEAKKVFDSVLSFISNEARVISSEEAIDIELAYTMFSKGKDSSGQYARFNNAFFGSIKFESKMEFAVSLRDMVYNNENIFRFLIIESTEDDTRIDDKILSDDLENKDKEGKSGSAKNVKVEKEITV